MVPPSLVCSRVRPPTIQMKFCQNCPRDKNCYSYTNSLSHSLHSDGWPSERAVFALQMHFHITHEGRLRNEREGRKEGRKEVGGDGKNLCKNRSRTDRLHPEWRREGRDERGGVLSPGRRFANGLPLAEERGGEREAAAARRRSRKRSSIADGRADGPTVTKDRLRRGRERAEEGERS